MPQEVALNVPFEAYEIIEIAVQEFRKRLLGLGPLHGGKEYAAFFLGFNTKIRLMRAGELPSNAKETLAWGNVKHGVVPSEADLDAMAEEEKARLATAEDVSTFTSGEPNDERQKRDMPLTVEASDGKGGKTRKKVKVKNAHASKGSKAADGQPESV